MPCSSVGWAQAWLLLTAPWFSEPSAEALGQLPPTPRVLLTFAEVWPLGGAPSGLQSWTLRKEKAGCSPGGQTEPSPPPRLPQHWLSLRRSWGSGKAHWPAAVWTRDGNPQVTSSGVSRPRAAWPLCSMSTPGLRGPRPRGLTPRGSRPEAETASAEEPHPPWSNPVRRRPCSLPRPDPDAGSLPRTRESPSGQDPEGQPRGLSATKANRHSQD